MKNQIINGDCFEVLKNFPDNYFDAVITDPPYGINLSHWDKGVDIPLFTSEVKRLLNDGFYCFFGQMPTVIEWINEANNNKLKYLEQIIWCKRNNTLIHKDRLARSFENIYIYTTNKKTFYNVRGDFSDVIPSGLQFDVTTIQNIARTLSYYELWIKRGEQPLNRIKKDSGNCRSRDNQIYGKTREKKGINLDRNYTNIWSFLPPSLTNRNSIVSHQHPTQKPLELMKRLVEMLTPENGLVLDPFAGSFTTAIACLETGRRYVCIEKEKDYFEIGMNRITQWHNEQLNKTGTHDLPDDILRTKEDSTGQMNLF